jgi:hypothetical protein
MVEAGKIWFFLSHLGFERIQELIKLYIFFILDKVVLETGNTVDKYYIVIQGVSKNIWGKIKERFPHNRRM